MGYQDFITSLVTHLQVAKNIINPAEHYIRRTGRTGRTGQDVTDGTDRTDRTGRTGQDRTGRTGRDGTDGTDGTGHALFNPNFIMFYYVGIRFHNCS